MNTGIKPRLFSQFSPFWRKATVLAAAALLTTQAFAALNISSLHTQPMDDYDFRQGTVAVTGPQQTAAGALNATVRWNEFGTPRTIINHGGFIATGLDADPVAAAANWLQANATLFGLSTTDMVALTQTPHHVGDFAFSDARAVSFRQSFGGMESAAGGLVTVGVINGQISIVTSSLHRLAADSFVDDVSLTPELAILAAAANVGFGAATVAGETVDGEWTTFEMTGLVGTQRARLRSFATESEVRPVYETAIVDNQAGNLTGYGVIVDAANGTILWRQNKVTQLMEDTHAQLRADEKPGPNRAPVNETFMGEYTPPADMPPNGACGPLHGPYTTPGPTYVRVVVSANATVASNDIFVNLHLPGGQVVYTDVGFGEVVNYEPGGPLPPGDWFVEICPLASSINPIFLPPNSYTGTFTFDDSPLPSVGADARWRYFQANPPVDLSSTDIRDLGCWLSADAPCDFSVGNVAARAPWDWSFESNTPSNTTSGNAAITGEAWFSPLTPAEQYRPVAPSRDYSYAWTNVWQTSGCSPGNLVATTGNDINAAVVNMFVAHNRMHDWSYYLGFTEVNSNAQVQNFGNTTTDRQNDPEIGNVQAGAVNGGAPSYTGRDNANQITLQDGVAPITNQYLWQALAGVIYPPCADGNYDMGIVGHEYGHMIQNRMTGGPAGDLGPSAGQGRRMGESWGDLTGMEIQNELGVVPVSTESPFAIGAYVLGSPDRGIRNYNMADSPLNYSNMQYDPFGNSSPHADGEIWSAINLDLRAAFITQHNGAFPASNSVRQRDCAEGDFPPQACPGNRRWVQIMHDGFLLQGGSPSMIDARDAQLASDVMRFAADPNFGNHQDAMWLVYARRGMGSAAFSDGVTDLNPDSDFSLPSGHALANANVEFVAQAIDESNAAVNGAEIYIGHYEARANPVATTGGGPVLIAPGTYDMIARANGYGHTRFSLTLAEGQTGQITISLPTNFASATKGATASGDGTDHGQLIDDTESTSWDFDGQVGDTAKVVTIALSGQRTINRIQASALSENGGNRFVQLRQFAVDGCVEGLIVDCSDPASYSELFVSSPDGFDGQPIRPLAPNLLIRSFDLPAPATVTHLRFRAIHNQCTGSSEFTRDDWAPGAVEPTDCRTGITIVTTGPGVIQTERDDEIHAAEFQAFGSIGGVVDDIDGDGITDAVDNCPNTPNSNQLNSDSDAIGDACDNCTLIANPTQCDTNGDLYGNHCDADLDNDNIVNSFDLSIMRDNFGASGVNDSDLDCDGIVNSFDLTIMRDNFGGNPGPSGLIP